MIDIAVMEVQEDRGITINDINYLLNKMDEKENTKGEYYPIIVDHPNGTSYAIGFIKKSALDIFGGTLDEIERFIQGIINDVTKETEDHIYHHHDVSFYIGW